MAKPELDRYIVEEADTLLPFLLAHVRGKSRNTVKSLLSRRQVQVDGQTVGRFDHPLRPGQRVTLLPKEGAGAAGLPFPILYEDDSLIAIDKPAGLLTMATDRERERTAYRLVHEYLGGDGRNKRLFLVHRLDRDTSGVVLFAKNAALKAELQDNWGELVRERTYLAVVEGAPPQLAGTVRSRLRETATHMVYSAERGGGKEAVTRYETLASAGGLSLLRVSLDTGRKNQIRVHMSDLGCPVTGDVKYGGRGRGKLGRLGLHAWALALTDPRTERELSLCAPAPEEFRRLFPDQI